MRAAFFDVDGTLTKERVWRGLMEYFKIHGGRKMIHMAFWSYHLPSYILYRVGMISQTSFRRPWAKHLAWYLRGKSVDEVKNIGDWITEEFLSKYWRDDVIELINQHLQDGDVVVVVSAGPKPIIESIAKKFGIRHVLGTNLKIKDGKYTGGVKGLVCIGENKSKLAKQHLHDSGIGVEMEESYAYADSPADVYLLEMVGHPVATHPDDDLLPIAKKRGWQIIQ